MCNAPNKFEKMSSNSRFVPLVLKTDTEPNMNKNFISSACKFLSLVFVFTLLSFSSTAQEISKEAPAIAAGESLFNANCKTCHRVHRHHRSTTSESCLVRWRGWVVPMLLLRGHRHFRAQVIEICVQALHLHIVHNALAVTKQELPKRGELEVATNVFDLHEMKIGAADRRPRVQQRVSSCR